MITISRRWSPLPAGHCTCCASPNQGQNSFRTLSAVLCILAIFFSSGGHWAVLQSIAYTRMVVEFAHKESLGTAVKKAFDGRLSCSLCPKIRDGYNEQRKAPHALSLDRLPEFVGQSSGLILFSLTPSLEIPPLLASYRSFSIPPPKPPPRVV